MNRLNFTAEQAAQKIGPPPVALKSPFTAEQAAQKSSYLT